MHLIVDKISKSFGKKVILNGISFELNARDSIAIIGESGCGKSILMRIISGILKQTSGKITFYDDNSLVVKPQIGYAFQLNALFDSYTIWQNISFKSYIESLETEENIRENVKKVLSLVNLSHEVMDFYPKDLSGGMQKRVAIARAIINNPNILFLDEPTSGLDPSTSAKIVETINGLHTLDGVKPIKISVIHDMNVVKSISNKVLFIKNRTIGWFGDTVDLENAQNAELQEFINASI